jgi:hypothetical protein
MHQPGSQMNQLQKLGTILEDIRRTALPINVYPPDKQRESIAGILDLYPQALLICLDDKDIRVHRKASGVLYLDLPAGPKIESWNHKSIQRLPDAKYLICSNQTKPYQDIADHIISMRAWAATELRNILNPPQPYDPFSL